MSSLLDAVGRADQDQLAFALGETPEVAHQLADAGRVDVVDLREVEQDVPLVFVERTFEALGQELGALAQLDDAFDAQQNQTSRSVSCR